MPQVVKGGSPCHIYFDTEFATESNPGIDGEAMLNKLMNACSRVLRSGTLLGAYYSITAILPAIVSAEVGTHIFDVI